MHFFLARMVKGRRKPVITIPPIRSTKAQASDLLAVYLKMLAPLSGAVVRIRPIYERELARKLQTDSADDLSSEIDAIAREINRLVLELTPDLRRWALRTEKVHEGKWARAVQAALDVTIETMIGPEDVRETLDAFLVRSTSLVRDVNEQARGRIADAVLRGIQQRTPTAKVAKEIAEATGMARKRARRIASHQAVNLSSALDAERQRQAGIDVWRWNHSRKRNPRPEHVARDGNLYSDDADNRGKLKGGQTVRKPPEDLPGQLPNCGCVRSAVLLLGDDVLG